MGIYIWPSLKDQSSIKKKQLTELFMYKEIVFVVHSFQQRKL